MIEYLGTDGITRKVRRNAKLMVPKDWEMQATNVLIVPLDPESDEFQEVRALFDKTMKGNYENIRSVDRIQNKPWFIQYSTFKKFSGIAETEERLFHGCTEESAKLIIHSFFNRSFAGVNGNVYFLCISTN